MGVRGTFTIVKCTWQRASAAADAPQAKPFAPPLPISII